MISITNMANLQTAPPAVREAPFFGTVARPDIRDSYINEAAAQDGLEQLSANGAQTGVIAGQDGQQVAALKMRVVHVANHTGDGDTYTVAPVMQQEGPTKGPLHFAKGEASSVDMHIGDTAVAQQAGKLLDLTRNVFGEIPPEK
jgi:hypothetical protein